MPEFETSLGRVEFDEVERIITPRGDTSIYRFQAGRLEALEGIVRYLRDSGLFRLVNKYQEPKGETQEQQTGRPPTRVYLACPGPQPEILVPQN